MDDKQSTMSVLDPINLVRHYEVRIPFVKGDVGIKRKLKIPIAIPI